MPTLISGSTGVNKITDGTVVNADMADDAIGIAELSATGTASSSTFLRGDNTWATAGGDNTPAFLATMSGSQSVANDTETKIAFDTEAFDTDSAFDPSTNYRFTVPSGEGGKYFISFSLRAGSPADTKKVEVKLLKNGSIISPTWYGEISPGGGQELSVSWAGVVVLAAADYIEVYSLHQSGSTETYGDGNSQGCHFAGYKLIGV